MTHAAEQYWSSDPWYWDGCYIVRFIGGAWLRLYSWGGAQELSHQIAENRLSRFAPCLGEVRR